MYRIIQDKLTRWRNSAARKPLVLKGARQVGKTHILKKWASSSFDQVHYVNFEKAPQLARLFIKDLDVKRIVKELAFELKTVINLERDVLILDEIQMAPKALTALKYFCEDMPGFAVCAAGSLLGVVLSEESFPVGKVTFLHLHPLSFKEFIQVVDDRNSLSFLPEPAIEAEIPEVVHHHLCELLRLYYVIGGMPEAINTYLRNKEHLFTAFTEVRSIQRDLLQTYENDFAKHAGKLNATHIQALFRNIPAQLAMSIDGSLGRFKFKEIMPGKKGFSPWERPLHWLLNAGIALQTRIANRAELPIEHFCESNFFKVYMHDVGLLGCAQDLDPSALLGQDYGLAKGYFAENLVAQEMRASHYHQSLNLYGWAERSAEIEFVRSYQGAVIPIEVKSGRRTQAKSLKQFCLQYRPPLSIKISMLPLSFDKETSRLNLPLYLASWATLL